MIKYKHDLEYYKYNPNRKAMKKWLLNLPTIYFNWMLDISTVMTWYNRYENCKCNTNDYWFMIDDYYYDCMQTLWLDCFKSLKITLDETNIITFKYLFYAFIALLSYPKNQKLYKISVKKTEIEQDFVN